ncbi:MAG: hypothetical protein L3J42_01590 [Hydrogenimonas sp.]|nr:hypothetical protein [Hydrogenimonas sp.]
MIFGKIDYLNLLPFHMFLKRRLRSSSEKSAWQRHGSVPSGINRAFKSGRIDAAVVSSIKSRSLRCTDMGIIADGEVRSVLLLPGSFEKDRESDTSNALAKVLKLEGRVVIGDKALRLHLQGIDAVDLAAEWKKRENLPFVFARLCSNRRHFRRIKKLTKEFHLKKERVPRYILKRKAAIHGITESELIDYLNLIYYKIGWREKRSLKRFLNLARR